MSDNNEEEKAGKSKKGKKKKLSGAASARKREERIRGEIAKSIPKKITSLFKRDAQKDTPCSRVSTPSITSSVTAGGTVELSTVSAPNPCTDVLSSDPSSLMSVEEEPELLVVATQSLSADIPPSRPTSLMSVGSGSSTSSQLEVPASTTGSATISVRPEVASSTIVLCPQQIPLTQEADLLESIEPARRPANLFVKPKEKERRAFFECHPIQDVSRVANISSTKEGLPRKWLTYSQEQDAVFCTVCIVFGSISSNFGSTGEKDKRHWASRVHEHEKSKAHIQAVSDYINWMHHNVIEESFRKQLQISKTEVQRKRDSLSRVIDVVKLIGKLGIAYRGSKHEAAHTFTNPLVNHGILLELILHLAKYDKITDDHVQSCITESSAAFEKWKKEGKKRMGRGDRMTFLSSNTINLILVIIRKMVKIQISNDIKTAGIFSAQLDTTQDVSAKDQVSIVLRYVAETNVPRERLFAMLDGHGSTGSYYVELLKGCLAEYEIPLSSCVGDSTDGASNMQGIYKGFSTLLSQELSTHMHTWCHAHVLNLVMGDVTGSVVQATSLFWLLNDVAAFLKKSYKRMKKWEAERKTTRRLQLIGETRWWAKDKALDHVFGTLKKPEGCLYIQVLLTLLTIWNDDSMDASVKVKAHGLFEQLLKYETVLTAHTFMQLFTVTSTLSKYLQTSGLDLLTAKRLISQASADIGKMTRSFDAVKGAADAFVSWATDQVRMLDIEVKEKNDLWIESKLPEKRNNPNPLGKYKTSVYNIIMDTASMSFHDRFTPETQDILQDLSYLDPRSFDAICEKGLPSESMTHLAKALHPFDESITRSNLQTEIHELAKKWDVIKLGRLRDVRYSTDEDNSDHDDHSDHDDNDKFIGDFGTKKHRDQCRKCAGCVYLLLVEYNMFTNAFSCINLAYRYLLTLSVTQVTCERSFSILKIIKSRIRSSLAQDHLEAFMLMKCEYDLVYNINNNEIIDQVANHSQVYERHLKC